MIRPVSFIIFLLFLFPFFTNAQDSQLQTQLKVRQLVEKKAEYHRLNGGEQDGYRIKIFFGSDRDQAQNIKSKFSSKYNEYNTYEEYQQPNFVILVGDFKTKLEAFQYLKKIQPDYPNAFIVKDKVRLK
jgi:hypothetical protein